MSTAYQMPRFDVAGKTVIVTGATRGVGRGIASTFAHFGANVVITARTAGDCAVVSADINQNYCKGGRCVGCAADSTKSKDIQKVLETAIDAFSTIDVLVNNASVQGKSAHMLSDYCDEENFDKVIRTNLKGVFLFSKAVAQQMREQKRGGRIINLSSVAALSSARSAVAYGAAEAGVLSLTRTMASEFAPYNITVNAVCHGNVITPMNQDFLSSGDIKQNLESATALGRLAAIEDITGPVIALATDCFSYMTGAYLLLDGGQMIKG